MPYKDKEKRKAWNRDYRDAHKEEANAYYKRIIRIQNLKSKYGLTLEAFDEILIKQNHKCAICGKHLIETQRCVDHDHETGRVRGILCFKCNTSLGTFQSIWNNSERLKAILDYLKDSIESKVENDAN